MKQIITILQPHRLEQIEQARHELDHMDGFTMFQVIRSGERGDATH